MKFIALNILLRRKWKSFDSNPFTKYQYKTIKYGIIWVL